MISICRPPGARSAETAPTKTSPVLVRPTGTLSDAWPLNAQRLRDGKAQGGVANDLLAWSVKALVVSGETSVMSPFRVAGSTVPISALAPMRQPPKSISALTPTKAASAANVPKAAFGPASKHGLPLCNPSEVKPNRRAGWVPGEHGARRWCLLENPFRRECGA